MKKFLVLLCLMILVLPAAYSLSASIGNAKAVLRVNASPEEPAVIERTILVNNKNDIPVRITVAPAKDFEKFVEVIDEEFVLQPGESKKAEFILTIDRGGTIEGKILVGFSPADPEVKENSVGLSSTIIIISEGPIIEDEEEEIEETEDEDILIDIPEEESYLDIEAEEEGNESGVSVSMGQLPAADNEDEEAENTGYSPNPLIGIMIIVVIVVVGLGLFFAVPKFMKQK
ncbi:hypothetical protein KY347_03685 [Candidatus Woesearchaeota archaeon]|nr:hypothetical protein [Candidatus Woesearchaeota archaeon]